MTKIAALVTCLLLMFSTMPARADGGAAAELQSLAKVAGAGCNGDVCPQLDLTMIELFSGHRARYCQSVIQLHDWTTKAQTIVPTELDGSSPQFRADQTWTYLTAIDYIKSLGFSVENPVPPRLNLTQNFPFAPFHTETCKIKLNVANGSLTVGSVQQGQGEADISYDLSFKNGTFYGVAPSGGGAVVIATPGTYSVYPPPR